MLAGIGGSTIAKAQVNMSMGEVSQWSAFMRERGPLSIHSHYKLLESHLDWITAKICWAIFRAAGATEVKISDFMMDKDDEKKPENQPMASLGDVLGILHGSGAKTSAKPPPKPKRTKPKGQRRKR